MGHFSFKLPDLGEGIVESEITAWHVKPGDTVEEDQHIADVMTDKANVEVSSPVSGTVVSLACVAGEILAVGREMICFEVEGDGNVSAPEKPEPSTSKPAEPDVKPELAAAPAPVKQQAMHQEAAATKPAGRKTPETVLFGTGVLASPSVRQRARDEAIDLAAVPGSGPAGRISHKDLDAFIAAGGALAVRPGKTKRQGHTDVKIIGMRRLIAQKMQQSKRTIPHYSYIEEIDVTGLEELRQHLNATRAEGLPKLTLLPFLVQALVKILPRFPHCNARYDDEAGVLAQFEAVHAGIAVMTDAGLMVPVIKHAESLSIWQVAAEIARVSDAARNGTAKTDELSGSTITITSLGAIGGVATTPIINAPETSIIGVNKIQERPVVKDGTIVIRKMMNLSSSFDHRIVDGFDGAQLVQALKHILETPGAIFVEEA
ncbi:dihydrolipoamide acetyltransferase family protein [Kordiimonas pumila]|uniref:Dihydrolipoamide acetyltransferase component of pyruvate dehydrogenase complex n=1 Tax=Kordiimonas pumila TaxID=2161677 RepID=A0ABV7D012_9PROT|nr:dihydrolipoamide acetyltransferase family protein [Kordiimonas pumila]